MSSTTGVTSSFCQCACHRGQACSLEAPPSQGSTPATIVSSRPPSAPPLPPQPPPFSLALIDSTTIDDRSPESEIGSISNASNGEERRSTFAEMIAGSAKLRPASNVRRPANNFRSALAPPPAVLASAPIKPPPPALQPPNQIGNDRLQSLVGHLLPLPKTKLKSFAWAKLAPSKLTDSGNVWSQAVNRFGDRSVIDAIDFDGLEKLFAATASPSNTIDRQNRDQNKLIDTAQMSELDSDANGGSIRRREPAVEVNLLHPKRSLNVNIFLKQFRGGIDDLVELIDNVNGDYLGLEKLRGLAKILPEPDEIEALRSYNGDAGKLGDGERFFLALIAIPNYRLRVESMLLKEEFVSSIDYMKPSMETIIVAAQNLKNSQSLQEVLFLFLLVGNYLNAGSYGGNAAGFKMTSLWKLVEIRANKHNVTLLHYVVAEIEKKNPRLLEMPKELKCLDDACKISVDTLLSDFRHLKEKTERISKEMNLVTTENDISQRQMCKFLESAKQELATVERSIAGVERLRLELAAFFCDDTHAFKMEDCFKIFATFCQRFTRAVEENAERRLQEEKAELRKRLKEQQKAKKEAERVAAADEPRLCDKYASLLNNNDVTIPYESHQSLVGVLTTSTTAPSAASVYDNRQRRNDDSSATIVADDESQLSSCVWRRMGAQKRRNSVTMLSSFTNRERPQQQQQSPQTCRQPSWRQKMDDVQQQQQQTMTTTMTATSDIDQHQRRTVGCPVLESASVDKPTECSPIFAKTFSARKETARVASVGDLRRRQERASVDSADCLGVRRSVWLQQRESRARSLLGDQSPTVGNGVVGGDLSDFLDNLQSEREQRGGSTTFGSRRVSQSKTAELLPVGKVDIDEMVRQCEQARREIELIGVQVDLTTTNSTMTTTTIGQQSQRSSVTPPPTSDLAEVGAVHLGELDEGFDEAGSNSANSVGGQHSPAPPPSPIDEQVPPSQTPPPIDSPPLVDSPPPPPTPTPTPTPTTKLTPKSTPKSTLSPTAKSQPNKKTQTLSTIAANAAAAAAAKLGYQSGTKASSMKRIPNKTPSPPIKSNLVKSPPRIVTLSPSKSSPPTAGRSPPNETAKTAADRRQLVSAGQRSQTVQQRTVAVPPVKVAKSPSAAVTSPSSSGAKFKSSPTNSNNKPASSSSRRSSLTPNGSPSSGSSAASSTTSGKTPPVGTGRSPTSLLSGRGHLADRGQRSPPTSATTTTTTTAIGVGNSTSAVARRTTLTPKRG